MLAPLTPDQQHWADETLRRMSLEQMIGHLLCPAVHLNDPKALDHWLRILEKVPLGCIFAGPAPGEKIRAALEQMQKHVPVPLLVAADLEHGAVTVEGMGTEFPSMMAAGAADDPELMRGMGRATALEGTHVGIHWTFSPVVDLNYNFQNPVTNTRALGDDPDRSIRLLPPLIQGMQELQLGATAKHFPGDGLDDRDQHLCTSLNTLPVGQWRETYGRVWKAAIDAGVMSVMSGHIAFPDFEGLAHDPESALPATLSRRLQEDLLRGELGFQGVIVSDAAPMLGIATRCRTEDTAILNLETGSDVFLFADTENDYLRLLNAVRSGRLSEARIRESVRRVIEMKARLNLHRSLFSPAPSADQTRQIHQTAQTIADRSVTLLRGDSRPPLQLKPGARILTVTIRYENQGRKPLDLTVFDEELKARGFQVEHLLNPGHHKLREVAGQYDAVFCNLYVTMHMMIGTIRTAGPVVMNLWRTFYRDHSHVFFTTFGNPYLLYEFPHLPNLLATFSPCEASQRSAVKAWLGEMPIQGRSPVRLPRVRVAPLGESPVIQQ